MRRRLFAVIAFSKKQPWWRAVMVAAEMVASSEAWKPAREFGRLLWGCEGWELQQAWTTHREQWLRVKVSQALGNLDSRPC